MKAISNWGDKAENKVNCLIFSTNLQFPYEDQDLAGKPIALNNTYWLFDYTKPTSVCSMWIC